ncbi:hypothetical protein LSCM1_03820 [Leishmania martiniquensis]|uniref:Calpain catalytic domain-containing protein n=1 Tax=Leishmania martiniquensis TaxID=1580590 RepID=A0A836H7H4_9TRYP|nr:hypothetical protein LSCM1_03820 [Leishmania martiniquensis]
MSYYIGYSQREIYKKRCSELGCACNSAVVQLLSDVPDDAASLTSLDLSRNFLGRKGIIPLLDVIESAEHLRSLDLRDQQLGNDVLELICARLRRHPSLLKLNLSNNPITLAVSSALLDLAKENSVLQYILLEKTLVRSSMVTAIEVQLEKNRALARAASTALPLPDAPSTRLSITTSPTAAGSAPDSESSTLRKGRVGPSLPAGSGTSAAASLLSLANSAPAAPRGTGLRQRSPAHELQHVFRCYTHTVADVLFDADPTKDIWAWCEARQYVFDDAQFSSHNDHLHKIARNTYGVASWRRIGELYPDATLFGWEGTTTPSNATAQQGVPGVGGCRTQQSCGDSGESAKSAAAAAVDGSCGSSGAAYSPATSLFEQLPTNVPEGFTWTFTAMMASVKEMESLYALFCTSATELIDGRMRVQRGTDCPGIYTMRIFVEGQWRYLVGDDFLPVDKYGRLIFTKPSMDGKAFWPCILEKMLAKLYGGYHALDSDFDQHYAGVDGPKIRRPVAELLGSNESLRRTTTSGEGGSGDADADAVAEGSLICEEVLQNCGRAMSRLTGGLYDSYPLHSVEAAPTAQVFEVLHGSLGLPPRHADGGGEGNTARFSRRTALVKRPFLGGRSISVDAAVGASAVPSCRTAAVSFSREAARTCSGIRPHCAYQVVRVCRAGEVRLLQLSNPWCDRVQWTGDWADDSPLWVKHPEVAEMVSTPARSGPRSRSVGSCLLQRSDMALSVVSLPLGRSLLTALSEAGESLKEASLSEGQGPSTCTTGNAATARPHLQKSTFWIAFRDFVQNFEWVHTCRVFGDEFQRQDVHGKWTRRSAGGSAREPSWHINPHYRLSFPYRSTVHVQLTRRDPRLRQTRSAVPEHDDGSGGVGLQLLRDTHYPLHCPPRRRESAALSAIACMPTGFVEDVAEGSRRDGSNTGEALGSSPLASTNSSGGCAFTSVLFSDLRQSGDHLSLAVVLEAGAQYWIVPTTYAPRVLDEFDFIVISTSTFMMQEAQELDYWDQRTVPSELLYSVSSNLQESGQGEGEVAIIFDSKTCISSDENLLLNGRQQRNRHLMHDAVQSSIESASVTLSSRACRVVVAATMDLTASYGERGNSDADEAYEELSGLAEGMNDTPTLQLAVVPGEVDAEGRPTRTIGDIDPHMAHSYQLDHHTVLETVILSAYPGSVEYCTVIGFLLPAGSWAHVRYQVWCSAPLLEVTSLPAWSKEEVELCWDDEKGSGGYHEGNGHPQVELSKLRPFQRFAVSLQVVEYDAIEPAIMFTVVQSDEQRGEPVKGRLAQKDVWSQSAYIKGTFLQSGFDLDEHPPASLIVIPCLQPTGSKGRCLLTISSDFADYQFYPLRTSAAAVP